MNRGQLENYINESYGVQPEFAWAKYPDYELFRRKDNRKWFALIMNVQRNKIGLNGTEEVDIADFKCDPVLIGSLLSKPGFFPAYHMSKSSWISVALDNTVSDDDIKWLVDISFSATAQKGRK